MSRTSQRFISISTAIGKIRLYRVMLMKFLCFSTESTPFVLVDLFTALGGRTPLIGSK